MQGVFVCAHKRAWLCVSTRVCAVSGMGFSVDDERQWSNRIDAGVIVYGGGS